MPKAASFQADLDSAHGVLNDAFDGMTATETALGSHSRGEARLDAVNFPVEEGLARETSGLLDRWRSQAVSLVQRLDAAGAALHLQFEQLFDESAGPQSPGLFGRRLAIVRAGPSLIFADLVALIGVSARFDELLRAARPVFVQRHRIAEDHLLRIIERRRRVDYQLEEIQRRADLLSRKVSDRAGRMIDLRSATALAMSEEERKTLKAEHDACLAEVGMLLPERETLRRLIVNYQDFVDALNAQIGMLNAAMRKLSTDIEQGIALLKAVEGQLDRPAQPLPDDVGARVAAFEQNVMAGQDVFLRKTRADEAFARRLEEMRGQPAAVPADIERQG